MPFVHDDWAWTFLAIYPPPLFHVVIECPQSPGTAAVSCWNPAAVSLNNYSRKKEGQTKAFFSCLVKQSTVHHTYIVIWWIFKKILEVCLVHETIHNYLILPVVFCQKRKRKGKTSKGLIQKTGYMQEKDQKEPMTVSSTNMKIPFCPIQVHVNSQYCLISCILKKLIEIYFFFLGPREWSLRSKTIDWNDALWNKVKCNQFYRGFLPKQSVSCDFLQRCLGQKPPTNDRPACPPTRRSAHWRFIVSNCLWSRIDYLFIICQGLC